MLTYGKKGSNIPVKAIYSDSLSNLQDKASKLRKKGFAVDKFGLSMPMSQLNKFID